jgi:hypothetical protein
MVGRRRTLRRGERGERLLDARGARERAGGRGTERIGALRVELGERIDELRATCRGCTACEAELTVASAEKANRVMQTVVRGAPYDLLRLRAARGVPRRR